MASSKSQTIDTHSTPLSVDNPHTDTPDASTAFVDLSDNTPADRLNPQNGCTDESAQAPQTIDELLAALEGRISDDQLGQIQLAYQHAERAHEGQVRRTGRPYITHPLEVASIVAEMNLDHYSVMCALLHDVLEDTATSKEALASEFGEEVADIVDGLSKLNHLEFKSKEDAQAESFRKMLLAMVSDIRVILIKLADRLHNMRTLYAMSPDKQRRIARETLEVYSPIANRLGMYSVKNELEDLGFRYMYPMRSRILQHTVQQARKNRHQVISKLETRITTDLKASNINAKVLGREKHLYSLFRKMRDKQLSFQEVFDMYAIRIVVNSIDECYRALGICHNLYKPMPRKFKDYIAVPKENNYQGLHTVLSYADGIPVEVQIRTVEMDEFAESGIAAHWVYKEGEANNAQRKTHQWLTSLKDMQDIALDAHDFLENVKVDLFPGEIYVFTPKGRIIQLPAEATPVDFAYAVHSQVGNTCVTAKVDRRLAPLSTPLMSGQSVEIITSPTAKPSPMWLNFVVSAKARTAIRHYLRTIDREKAAEFGERLLNRALARYNLDLKSVSPRSIQLLLSEFHFAELRDLFVDVGLGNHLPSHIIERLMQKHTGASDDAEAESPTHETAPLMIEGREGAVLQLSKCCRPIPGDKLQAFITAGKGIAVHRAGCRNVRRFRRRPKEWVAVDWSAENKGDFEAMIVVDLVNRPGTLARISSTLSTMNANIEGMDFDNKGENNIVIHFVLSIKDRQHLARIIRRLRNLTVVLSVRRE